MAGTNLICYVSCFDMVCAGNSWLLKFSWFSWFHYRYGMSGLDPCAAAELEVRCQFLSSAPSFVPVALKALSTPCLCQLTTLEISSYPHGETAFYSIS